MDATMHESGVACKLSGLRVLVVGGAGFIGQHVVAAFRDAGAAVSILDRVPPPERRNERDWIVGSIADASLVASTAAGSDVVVFLANSSLPGSSHANLAAEVEAHVGVTVRAAEICAALGVKRFLFASSGGTVYGIEPQEAGGLTVDMPTRPLNAYGVSKLAIEHYLRLIGETRDMSTVVLRISNPYGEGQRAVRSQGFVAAAMEHAIFGTRLPVWGDGTVERDFIHVADVAKAFVLAANCESRTPVLNVGVGTAVSLNAMLRMIEEAVGRRIAVDYQPSRAIDVRRNFLDITRTTREIGWRPSIDLASGLERTARWWIDEAADSITLRPPSRRTDS
ncbi:NAD-dependent epimerase/dehydratase family protein [Faunimonas sp. B44]|uniref:NAD-dependent epimerase/dehydratase family protein n=1 Tax=Faunimonas sp. B44 TaxID=3461493 RepID=UPI004043A721